MHTAPTNSYLLLGVLTVVDRINSAGTQSSRGKGAGVLVEARAWLLGISWAWGHKRRSVNCHSRRFAELAFSLSDGGSV